MATVNPSITLEQPEKLSLGERLGYGVGDLGSNVVWGMTTAFLLFFYTDVFGLTAAAVGTLFVVARLFDAINDPIMGVITERVHTRWGKFRHYLLFGSPIFGLLLILTFSTPNLSSGAKLFYAYVTYIVLGVAYTVVNIPYGALAATMTQDPGDRNSLSFLRSLGLFIGGGLIVGVATPALVENLGGGDPARGFQLAAVIYAVIGVICLWTTFATSKERYVATDQGKLGLGTVLRALRKNRPFIMLTISSLLAASAGFMRIASPVFYMTYYVSKPELLGALLGIGTIATLVGITLGGQFFAARFGKRNTNILGLATMALFSLAMFFTPSTAVGLQIIWYGLGALGIGFGMAVFWSMLSDTVEFGEWKTGIRAEGGTYSISSFVIKLASAIAGGLPALILARTGYVPNVEQSEQAQFGILAMMTLIPLLIAFLAIVPLLFYKLDEKMFAQILEELAARK